LLYVPFTERHLATDIVLRVGSPIQFRYCSRAGMTAPELADPGTADLESAEPEFTVVS
jgi:hypothetical protein